MFGARGILMLLIILVWIFISVSMVGFGKYAWGQALPWGNAAIMPHGERFEIDYVSPAIHKWYSPRFISETYMQSWYSSDTNYSSIQYKRYLNRLLEGEEHYDSFGNPLGRGWLVYSWEQEQPGPRGSFIDKNLGGLSSLRLQGNQRPAYRDFFSRLVIASDQRGDGLYRLMVGDEIFTRFTPLTFYKPRFNGVRLDNAGDRRKATLLLARPSNPDEESQTNATTLMAGHLEFDVGHQLKFGGTYVNAHNVVTQADFDEGNPLHGILTTNQNQSLDKIWIRIRDDSPGKGSVGAALAGFDIVLVDTSGRHFRGSEVGFLPSVDGGILQAGRLFAHDEESIVLEYDLGRFDVEKIQSKDLQRVWIELSVANDYRIETASDLQTNGERRNPEIVYLTSDRARENVQDNTNTSIRRIEYGLPTASELIGVDWNLFEWQGLSLRGEWVLNRRYFRYPNPAIHNHFEYFETASAGYLDACFQRGPWSIRTEIFEVEDSYSTFYWLTSQSGRMRYKSPIPHVYEFVDDDDDMNGLTEWQRPFFVNWGSDTEQRLGTIQSDRREVAWPGLDENGDFINDHNQNRNFLPDYDEPFLRFRSDRPEFLFGLDMNHNGVTDRFENDTLPDYPYKKDHRGYNAFLAVEVVPGLRWQFGHQNMKLISGDGKTISKYYVATWVHNIRGGGRLRIASHGARVRDTIVDDLRLWRQPENAPGRMVDVRDLLPGRDALKNSFYVDLDHRIGPNIQFFHRLKWDWTEQFEDSFFALQREVRSTSYFLGIINKAEWSIPVRLGVIEPRWKSEYRRVRPYSTREDKYQKLEQIVTLIWTQPLLAENVGVSYFPKYGRQLFSTELQTGVEASRSWISGDELLDLFRDGTWWTAVAQVQNRTAYQGYKVVTRVGMQSQWRYYKVPPGQQTSLFFLTVNASLNQ